MRKNACRAAARRCLSALLCLLTGVALCGCAASGPEEPVLTPSPSVLAPLPEKTGLRIAVASDTHLDPDNTDKSLGVETVYNMEILDAMLWDVREQGAELLLITGDLCNSGKTNKHAALAEKLRAAEAEGITACVLPGNHDLAPLRQTEFAEYYGDFGYDEAFSRDTASLSYCILRDGLMILMMDTGGYAAGAVDLPGAAARDNNEAFLSDTTLRWAEEMLKRAEAENKPVIAAGHYNLLPEISRQPGSGYYIENGERFAALLRKYDVPLYLSGHMHLRAVYQEGRLTEQLTECLIAYPTGYTVLDLDGDALHVTPRRVDVAAWAAETGQSDPVLLDFAFWQERRQYDYCRVTAEAMSARNPIPERDLRYASDFFYTVMRAYWDGSLSSRRDEIRILPGYEPFFRCAEGYSYGWWLKDLIETASPLLPGYTLKS